MRNAKIIGTGVSVPDKILTNADLSHIFGEDINEFVDNNLGIDERHVLAENESAADIATKAAENALKEAGISAGEIDLIIVATDTRRNILRPELPLLFSTELARKKPEHSIRTRRARVL